MKQIFFLIIAAVATATTVFNPNLNETFAHIIIRASLPPLSMTPRGLLNDMHSLCRRSHLWKAPQWHHHVPDIQEWVSTCLIIPNICTSKKRSVVLAIGLYSDHAIAPVLLWAVHVATCLASGRVVVITRLPINDQLEAIDWKQHPLSGNGTRRLRGKCPYFSASGRKTTTTKILTHFRNQNGSPVVLDNCTIGASVDQIWTFKGSTISAYNGTMCLEVPDGASSNGVELQICQCSPTNVNQQWNWTTELSCTMRVEWKNHRRCLDLTDGNLTIGTAAQIWDCIGYVKAFHVSLITDSRKDRTTIKARFFITFLL